MSIDLKQVQEFFFVAMMQGYVGNVSNIKTTSMPQHRDIDIVTGDWRLLDRFCVPPLSIKSVGTTTIWYENKVVWWMQYGGFYEDRAILFLKKALKHNYEIEKFEGGRGPHFCMDFPLIYTNRVVINDFARFMGREEIHDGDKMLGYHDYSGMSLLP